jgi:hypothetical protein
MLDLYNKKYDRETLKKHIYEVKLIDILKTQTIDVSFATKYILNRKYQLLKEEINITPKMVLYFQPHISSISLKKSLLLYDSDDDTIEDFETVSNK